MNALSNTEIKPLASSKAYSCMLSTEHVRAMVKAMKAAGCFTVTEDKSAGTIDAYHTASRRQVFAAIAKSDNGPWIIRHHNMLFAA